MEQEALLKTNTIDFVIVGAFSWLKGLFWCYDFPDQNTE